MFPNLFSGFELSTHLSLFTLKFVYIVVCLQISLFVFRILTVPTTKTKKKKQPTA